MHHTPREPRNEYEANVELLDYVSSPRPQFLEPKRREPRSPFFSTGDLVIAIMAVASVVAYVMGVFQ